MSIHNQFYFDIQSGKMIRPQMESERYKRYVQALPDGSYYVELKKVRRFRNRSNDQNRYYWGVVIDLIAEHTGYTAEELHEALLLEFMGEDTEFGIRIAKRSSQMDTAEFSQYIEKIRNWAMHQHGIFIPEPDPFYATQ